MVELEIDGSHGEEGGEQERAGEEGKCTGNTHDTYNTVRPWDSDNAQAIVGMVMDRVYM
jgi:hypothetical protein